MTPEEIRTMYDNTSQIDPWYKVPAGYLKVNNSVRIAVYDKLPCRFHRWMAKVLLGWEYTEGGEQ